MTRFIAGVLTMMLGAVNAHAQSTQEPVTTTPAQQYVEVWLGTTDTDDSWTLEDSNGATAKGDFSSLPLGGGAGQWLHGQRVQYGYEGGGLVAWKHDDISFVGSNNSWVVSVDTELFMMDVFMGGVIAVRPTRWMRIYAAAGPSIAWGYLDGDGTDDGDSDETSLIGASANGIIVIDGDDSASDFSFSLYGRVGLDFEFNNGFSVGVSARYTEHEFDFDDRGELNVDEVQWFLTIGHKI